MASAAPKTNKRPVASADNAAIVEEVTTVTGNVLANDKDPNPGDTIAVTTFGTFVGTYGTLVLYADGSYTYTLSPSVQSLSAGQKFDEIFDYTIADQYGVTGASRLKISITGLNDAPVIAAVAPSILTEPTAATPITTSIAVAFTDIDLTDIGHTASITSVVASGATTGLALTNADLLALLTVASVAKAGGSSTGAVNLSFATGATDFQYLGDGESVTLTYLMTVSDGDGGTVARNIVLTIQGTNDLPVITAGPTNLTEQTDTAVLAASIDLGFTDVDATDVSHTANITGVVASGTTTGLTLTDTELAALLSVVSIGKTGGSTSGRIALAFAADSTVFDYLGYREVLTLTYTVQVDDGHGGLVDQQVVITINGTDEIGITVIGADADDATIINNVQGSGLADSLFGGDALNAGNVNNSLFGYGSYDVIVGGTAIGAGSTAYNFVYAGTGHDDVTGGGNSGGHYVENNLNGEAGDDTLIGGDNQGGTYVFNYLYAGTGNDTVAGGNVTGGSYAYNFLYGGADNDSLTGGGNSGGHEVRNVLYGEDGDDTLVGGSTLGTGIYAYNYLYGGAGNDTVTGGSTSGTGVVLNDLTGDDANQFVPGSNDVLIGGDNTGAGGSVTNYLRGDGGTLSAQGGNDRLVSGQTATDHMWGDAEVMSGVGGNDTFAFAGAFGSDYVYDFRSGEDHFEFAVDDFAKLSIAVVGTDTVITAAGGTVTLVGFTSALGQSDFVII